MSNDDPLKAVLVTLAVAFVCSVLVTTAAIALKPRQEAFAHVERNRHLVEVAGLTDDGQALTEHAVIDLVVGLDARVVDLDAARFSNAVPAVDFDQRAMAADPDYSEAIPPELDIAKLGRRSRYAEIWLVREGNAISRIVLPVHGRGMWSMLYGFLALEGDFSTIADEKFYEQEETPGVGDRILDPKWRASWRGKRAFDPEGRLRFDIVTGGAPATSEDARYHIDGITGATRTVRGVDNLIRYWLGPNAFGPFLEKLRKGELVE